MRTPIRATVTGRRLLTVGIALLCACRTPVSSEIGRQIDADRKEVDLRTLKVADWDHLFVFGPYTPAQSICEAIELDETACRAADFGDVDEGSSLVVLVSRGSAAYREIVPRSVTDFDASCFARAIDRSEALLDRTAPRMLACR